MRFLGKLAGLACNPSLHRHPREGGDPGFGFLLGSAFP